MSVSLAETMAVAVLRGDLSGARALADLLINEWEGGATELPKTHLPPLHRVSVPRDRIRVVAHFPTHLNGNPVRLDLRSIAANVEKWLTGTTQGPSGGAGEYRCNALVLQGCSHFELYELPEWAAKPPSPGPAVSSPAGPPANTLPHFPNRHPTTVNPPTPETATAEAYRRLRAIIPEAFDPTWEGDEASYRTAARRLNQLADEARTRAFRSRLARVYNLPPHSAGAAARRSALRDLIARGSLSWADVGEAEAWVRELGEVRDPSAAYDDLDLRAAGDE